MKPKLWSIVLTSAAALLLLAIVQASPQFDTPNRAFHNATAFKLEGKHQTVACESCHLNGQFRGTPTGCYDCHWVRRQDDRLQTRLGTQCEQCHRPTAWTAINWNHASTGMALNADHRQIACETCHRNANFKAPAADCVSCHQKDYLATTSPKHATAGFPVTCEGCHKPSDSRWQGGTGGFSHNSVFALVGVHATATCVACHVNNVYRGTARTCVGCHQADYNRTTNPNHVTANFSTNCESCHRATDASFQGATFNHNSVFALVGVHATATCVACHVNNIYRGTARTCVGCHQADYNRTTSPNHVAANFPTTCETCHQATAPSFQGATFNHSAVFALVGVHATATCASCHINNVYRGTARTCVGCHLPAYNSAQNPSHLAAGFPTTCETCHRATDANWTQGTFNHTRFPLTGNHNVTCARCHTTTNNFQVFSCTVCHGRSQTDSHHQGRNGYVYESNACYSCHPNGRAG
ncbi:MAG: cytochrome c3 family protein [Vicinamibacterales bacterium]